MAKYSYPNNNNTCLWHCPLTQFLGEVGRVGSFVGKKQETAEKDNKFRTGPRTILPLHEHYFIIKKNPIEVYIKILDTYSDEIQYMVYSLFTMCCLAGTIQLRQRHCEENLVVSTYVILF